ALLAQGRERYPESGALALAESVLLERQGDLSGAETAVRAGLERQPGNLDAVNRLAILQARQGDLSGAQATLEEVAAADPNLQVNLAQIYIQAGQSRAAVELLDELLQNSPEDAQLWTLYGIASGRAGRYSQALDALDRAIALEPDNDDVRRARSVVEQAMSITQGQEVELSGEARAPFEAGLAALEGGDMGRAASEFARARGAEDSGVAAFYHGFALQLSGQPRQAVAAYERAQQDYPDNSVIANNLGYAYLQVGRLDRALEHISRAIQLDEENARAHMNLGLTLFRLGRYADAVSSWERATTLDGGLESELSELLETARSRAN
ncbi:MAG: tetratricopeptide repeat protein, partial [Deinococcota bacterium]|nr:tetratricopeptide repeat protein [Deinococcota bacterium]